MLKKIYGRLLSFHSVSRASLDIIHQPVMKKMPPKHERCLGGAKVYRENVETALFKGDFFPLNTELSGVAFDFGPVGEVSVACLSLFSIKTQFPDEKRGVFLKGTLCREPWRRSSILHPLLRCRCGCRQAPILFAKAKIAISGIYPNFLSKNRLCNIRYWIFLLSF